MDRRQLLKSSALLLAPAVAVAKPAPKWPEPFEVVSATLNLTIYDQQSACVVVKTTAATSWQMRDWHGNPTNVCHYHSHHPTCLTWDAQGDSELEVTQRIYLALAVASLRTLQGRTVPFWHSKLTDPLYQERSLPIWAALEEARPEVEQVFGPLPNSWQEFLSKVGHR